MSVATTKHLKAIDLFESDENDPGKISIIHITLQNFALILFYDHLLDVEINFLMKQSLRTVMSLPLHLVMDTWRWKIFKGKVPVRQWNREFWNQRYAYNITFFYAQPFIFFSTVKG